MENLQIKLTVLLLLIEVIAFAWLIIDIQKSKRNQNKIIELEHQILKVEDSINDILKNVDKLSNHLNAYKTYHDKLGNTLGTAVNHYNDSTKEFKKIDKDVIKISSGNSQLNITSEAVDKPLLED